MLFACKSMGKGNMWTKVDTAFGERSRSNIEVGKSTIGGQRL